MNMKAFFHADSEKRCIIIATCSEQLSSCNDLPAYFVLFEIFSFMSAAQFLATIDPFAIWKTEVTRAWPHFHSLGNSRK